MTNTHTANGTRQWQDKDAPPFQKDAPAASQSSYSKPSPMPAQKPFAQRIVDLADVEPPGELPLMFGQYLLKGSAHWLTGQTGIGKSTFVYNLVCALAEGSALWGLEVEQTKVLYVDMESGDVGRALKVQRLYQDTPRVRGQLLFLREPMRLPDELPDLLAYVQTEGIALVVFDTARRCFTVKDENDNAEVYAKIVPTLDGLKSAGVATLTLGHPAKNGNSSARGAGAQEDAGDVNLTLTMHKGEVADADGVIALRVTKNRLLGLGVTPLYLRRVGNDQFENIDSPAAGPEETLTKRMQCRTLIVETLESADEKQAGYSDLWKAALGAGFTKYTFTTTLREMKDALELLMPGAKIYRLADPFAEDEE